MPLIQYGQFDAIIEAYTRITETSDTRITEAGDTRITNDGISNTVVGSLVANPTFTKFSSQPFINEGGVWKLYTPYIKHEGVWKEPELIYKKISGQWRRIY